MGKNLKESLNAFKTLKSGKALSEGTRMEAPVAGFNRHLRDMSPVTREIVLKARMPEIMAFAEDRRVDPGLVAGIAETTMRLGRIPDLGMFGLGGDVAIAVKDFLADTVLNVAEDEEIQKEILRAEVETLGESAPGLGERDKHLKYAADYNKLADFHRRRAKEEADKAKMAKDNDKEHSFIHHNADSEHHSALARNCSGLADYHQRKANESTGTAAKPPAYPAANPKKLPPEPPQDEPKEKSPPASDPKDRTEGLDSMAGGALGGLAGGALGGPAGKVVGSAVGSKLGARKMLKAGADAAMGRAPKLDHVENFFGASGSKLLKLAEQKPEPKPTVKEVEAPKTEQTTQGSIANSMVPLGKSAFPMRSNSILPMIERCPAETKYTRWGGDKKLLKKSAQDRPTDYPSDDAEDEHDHVKPMESVSRFRQAETMESLLEAAKSKKSKRRKAKVDPDKQKGVLANVRIAPLFQDLGHKMDHACAKVNGHKFKPEYTKDLYNTCLKQGGGAAADKVVQMALKEPWIRDQGFVDESSNLRRKWETAMSQDALHKASPTEPEPLVFAVNNIVRMSNK